MATIRELLLHDYYALAFVHIMSAFVAGCLIGIERSSRGRDAGFRTHALVCVASALLMLVPKYQWDWLEGVPMEAIRSDPIKMAEGIMAGIGFLGAGVIIKRGLNVRGLTTAASIWLTAAIGILFGTGLYMPAVLATLLALGTLSLLRVLERLVPSEYEVNHAVSFARERAMPEPALRRLVTEHGFKIAQMGYQLRDRGGTFEYQMVLKSRRPDDTIGLAATLRSAPDVLEFSISPSAD
jgi:putative Mg2+ transporter-C (MgtC) family protein